MGASHHHQKHTLDAYANLKSPLHRWEMRSKIGALLLLILSIAMVKDIRLLPGCILIALLIYALSQLPWGFLRARLAIPGYFIIALVIFLPFVGGDASDPNSIAAEWRFLTVYWDGLEQAGLIIGRFFCIFTLGLVLFSTNTFLNAIRALRGLKFPSIMADMILLTFRYLFQMRELFQTIRTAARVRGFQANTLSRDTLSTLATLTGHLIVRSYDQSESVYHAMILRGYGLEGVTQHQPAIKRADWLKTAVTITIAFLILIISIIL